MGDDENADECAEKTTGKASVGFGADVKGGGSSKVGVTSSLPTAVENFVKSKVSRLLSHMVFILSHLTSCTHRGIHNYHIQHCLSVCISSICSNKIVRR